MIEAMVYAINVRNRQ